MANFVFHDPTRCNGCGDCVAECKRVHGLGPWVTLLRVVKSNQPSPNGRVRQVWEWKSCRHCDVPDCIPACSTGAIQKRADGIVLIEATRCDGCRDCISACTIRAICLDLATRKAIKCDLCQDRVDQGRVPACVARCTAQALFFGTKKRWEAIVAERTAW